MLKYFFLVVISFLLSWNLSAQSFISGKVRDSKTLEPLPFANVYINNTTIGVAANQDGEYLLKNVPTGINEIVFSFVGYQTNTTKIRANDGETIKLNIKLKQVEKELENVSINSTRDKDWEKRMRRFQRVFLGETKNAANSKILNAWCIELNEDKSSGIKRELTATSTQPIEVENLALGYKVFYDLKAFSSTSDYYKFNGNVFFQAIKTTDSVQASRWTKNRLDAYRGSTRHLFKAILDNRLTEEGFLMYAFKSEFQKKTMRSTVFSQDLNRILTAYNPSGFFLPGRYPGEFKVTLKPKIEIHYLKASTAFRTYSDVMVPVSNIELTWGYVEVDQNGIILNPKSLITSGHMGKSRVADLLPYDYVPGNAGDFVPLKLFSKEQLNLDRLQEEVYLHTDKSYYYPGEVIWFKGYMKYNYPEILDSLSAVLYVDLIGPDRKVVQTKMFPIDSGHVAGDIALPGSVQAGNYCLRSYTNWMRNYPEDIFFIKPLPVLGIYDNLELVIEKPVDSMLRNQIEIKSDKESYHVRDSISVSILLKDEYDNPIQAGLSVSVTDAAEVISLPQETIIDKFSKVDDVTIPGVSKAQMYQVEHGISIGGQFRNRKGKPEQKMKIQIIQGDFEDMTTVNADEQGNFWTSGFQFNDSLEFAFRATDITGRSYGKVTILPKEFPAVPDSLPILNLPVKKIEFKNRQIQRYDETGNIRMLKEVVINASKIEEKRPFTRYGTPDNSINGDLLENANYSNLMYVIQSRVPGLRLVLVNGSYVVSLGGFVSYGASDAGEAPVSGEPLLIIDGLAFNGSEGVADMISQLSISNILRIDVFKFGSAAAFGARGANGVIAIYTRNGTTPSKQVKGYDKSLFQLEIIQGFARPLKFKSPNYNGVLKTKAEPDYRSTIYWAPSVNTNPQTGEAVVSFYAADLETKYRVVVEGVTLSGEPIHAEYFIKVLK